MDTFSGYLDELTMLSIPFLLVEILCLYPTAMYFWHKYILKYGVTGSAKVKFINKTKVINRYTWRYKRAEKKAPTIYHLTLTYTVENIQYTKTFSTGILPNTIEIRVNDCGEMPIKYLRKYPHAVVCTSEIFVKAMNKTKIYVIGIVVTPILAVVIGAIMVMGFKLIAS